MRTAYLLIQCQSDVPTRPEIVTSYNIHNEPIQFPHYLNTGVYWTESAPLRPPKRESSRMIVLAAGTQDANAKVKVLAAGWKSSKLIKELRLRVLEKMQGIMEACNAELHWSKEMWQACVSTQGNILSIPKYIWWEVFSVETPDV